MISRLKLRSIYNEQIKNHKLFFSAKVTFKLENLGEGIKKAKIKEWYVEEGQEVEIFDSLALVESENLLLKFHQNTMEQ